MRQAQAAGSLVFGVFLFQCVPSSVIWIVRSRKLTLLAGFSHSQVRLHPSSPKLFMVNLSFTEIMPGWEQTKGIINESAAQGQSSHLEFHCWLGELFLLPHGGSSTLQLPCMQLRFPWLVPFCLQPKCVTKGKDIVFHHCL